MTNILPCLVKRKLCCMLGLVLCVFAFSCGQQGDSSDPKEKLTAYCIRECVLETADSEICDTKCKCAAQNLSEEYSKEDFMNLVQDITQDKTDNVDSIDKLKHSLKSCKDTGEKNVLIQIK